MGQVRSPNVCGNCGTVNVPGDQFCANCGYALAGGPTQPVLNAPTTISSSAPTSISYGGRRVTGTLQVGNLLSGRYRIVRLVGKGGFGAVYEARDERFQRRVLAIKEMSDAQLTPKERVQALQDFRREAELLVDLKHPNLPEVSDFFEESGKAYLVMEYIEGKTLEQEQDAAGGPLNEKLVMGWALQLCDVLYYLHTQPQPIIFRDMKPSNVMVTKSGQIKLIDFGIARVFKSTAAKDTTTLGSSGYAPLEQYGKGQSDARSDIYALGATLYDLLTNEVPADAPSRRINQQAFKTPRQLNPAISPAAERIVLKAMEQEPKDRFQSAAEMAQAIVASGLVGPTISGSLYSSPTMANTLATQLPRSPSSLASTRPAPPVTPPIPGSGAPGRPAMSAPPVVYPAAPPQVPPSAPPKRRGGQYQSRRAVLIGIGGVAALAAVGGGLYFFSRRSGTTLPVVAGPTITVNLIYSTEKDTWIRAVTNTFNQNNITLNGKTIQIVAMPTGSGDAETGIKNGTLKPTAWSPASFLELNQLSINWQQAHGGADVIIFSGPLLPKSLVFSPLVFAVWQERAKVLLAKYGKIDWPAVHDALTKKSWSDIGGQSTWGPVKFGQTSPLLSNSGLLTITLMAYAALGKQRGLTPADIASAQFQQFFNDVEGAVNAFGRSSGTFLQNVVILQGPAQYDVTTTYENLVLLDQGQAMSRWNQPLQLYYPPTNILSDHPFAILKGDWVTAEEQQAAGMFRDFLLDVPQQQLALASGFRPTNSNVHINDNVPQNRFKNQPPAINLSQQIDTLTLAQAPRGDVVNALLDLWSKTYGTAPLATSDTEPLRTPAWAIT